MQWLEDARRLWPLVEQMIPVAPERDPSHGGRPRIDDETVFVRLVLFLRAGCSWDAFDELCRGAPVSGRTCRRRLAEWADAGVFERVCDVLRSELPPAEIAHLDATFVRSRGGGDEHVGLTRHGKGSKIQALCDEHSRPISFQLTSANYNDSTITTGLLDSTCELPALIVADKAYDWDYLRDAFDERGTKLLAPHRANRGKPPRDQEHIGRHYKQRWRVERFFAWLAAWRRLATRWERNIERYWQWLCLGTSLIYIRTSFVRNL
jgi:transposase